jgi:ribonucleoside-diphosphate reductase beta chain
LALSLAIFSAFNEGVNLFSSFAVLLSFSKRNLLKGVGQIIAFSVADEALHSNAGCELFRILIKENPEIFTDEFKKQLYDAARLTVELEDDFLHQAFSKGEIEGLSLYDMKQFIRHRANLKLEQLGLKKNWKNLDKEALDRMLWFDAFANPNLSHTDFFSARVNSYSKGQQNWEEIWGEDKNE